MALWGLVYDLRNFGKFNFMSLYVNKREHDSGFGVLSVFENLGYFIGPVIAGAVIVGSHVYPSALAACLLFLFASALAYGIFMYVLQRNAPSHSTITHRKKLSLPSALSFLIKAKGIIWIPLSILFLVCIIDAFYWTLGPLLETRYGQGSYFIPAYMLPSLFVGWFIGSISVRIGKVRACFISLFLGGILLASIPFWHAYFTILAVVFVSSLCIAISLPVAQSLLSDTISEHPSQEKSIETITDFIINVSWFVGPVAAGFAGERLGIISAFSFVGVFVSLFALFYLLRTPAVHRHR
jgi:MFS family permease